MEADKEGREGVSEKRQDEKELDAKQEAEVQNEGKKGDDVKEMNILDRILIEEIVKPHRPGTKGASKKKTHFLNNQTIYKPTTLWTVKTQKYYLLKLGKKFLVVLG